MDRPTEKFTTENGYEIEVYEYATGREFQDIQKALFKSMKVGIKGKNPEIEEMDFSKQTEATNKALKTLVVSVDGEGENVLDKILDLPYEDYQEVEDKVNNLTGKKKATNSDEQ